MLQCALFTGKNAQNTNFYIELEEDLIALTKEHGAQLATYLEILTTEGLGLYSSEIGKKKFRLYEIPSKGAINIQVSSQRDIEVSNIKCDGLVTCVGFDESGKYFKKLNEQLLKLCKAYSNDRV